MKAVFIELPPFARRRQDYLDDDAYGEFQRILLANPLAGDVIEGTGGLRKMRYRDSRRSKGKRVVCESSTTGGSMDRSSGYSPFTIKTRLSI